jgi:hypothetical protein
MKTRPLALASSTFGFLALAACGAPPSEATSQSNEALSLPVSANWMNGQSNDAIVLGTDSDGSPLFSCRAAYAGSIVPGKTRAGWGSCDVGYAGAENWVTTYQTLVPVWTNGTYGAIPDNAMPFGTENGNPLYVCRALDSHWTYQVGKTGNGIQGCAYPYGGQEIVAPGYQVLSNKFEFDIGTQWVAPGAALPFNALRAGTDDNGAALYACIAPYNGDMHPGKTQAGWGACDVSYGGQEIWVSGTNYQVLVPALSAPPVVAPNAMFVGGNESWGGSLGVCTAAYGTNNGQPTSRQVGKLIASGACNFGTAAARSPSRRGCSSSRTTRIRTRSSRASRSRSRRAPRSAATRRSRSTRTAATSSRATSTTRAPSRTTSPPSSS